MPSNHFVLCNCFLVHFSGLFIVLHLLSLEHKLRKGQGFGLGCSALHSQCLWAWHTVGGVGGSFQLCLLCPATPDGFPRRMCWMGCVYNSVCRTAWKWVEWETKSACVCGNCGVTALRRERRAFRVSQRSRKQVSASDSSLASRWTCGMARPSLQCPLRDPRW